MSEMKVLKLTGDEHICSLVRIALSGNSIESDIAKETLDWDQFKCFLNSPYRRLRVYDTYYPNGWPIIDAQLLGVTMYRHEIKPHWMRWEQGKVTEAQVREAHKRVFGVRIMDTE